MIRVAVAAAVALVVASCSDPSAKAPPPAPFDAGRPKRVFEPPPGEVRPVPPFAIRSDGVGPYLIGASLSEVLDTVPRGPRIELMTIEGVAEFDLVRAEDDGLLIGRDRSLAGDRTRVAFVAALAPEVAKTATGIGVGAKEEELAEALSGPVTPPNRTTDPRVREFASLPGVRFILVAGRVSAVIVAPRPHDREPERPASTECRGGEVFGGDLDALASAARLESADDAAFSFGCFSGDAPEALVVGDDRVTVVGGDPDKLRRIAGGEAKELRYAAPIDVDGDGRDEVVLVFFQKREKSRVARVELARVDGGKLVTLQGYDAYEVSSSGAAWTGAHVEEVDLLVEVSSDGKALSMGGLYMHRVKGGVREVVPLISRTERLKKERPH